MVHTNILSFQNDTFRRLRVILQTKPTNPPGHKLARKHNSARALPLGMVIMRPVKRLAYLSLQNNGNLDGTGAVFVALIQFETEQTSEYQT